MPIYKMNGTKNGLQKYRVRVNYRTENGEGKQIDRVAYGNAEAKELERKLLNEIKEKKPEARMTLQELYEEYVETKKHEVRETSLAKTKQILNNHVLQNLKNKKLTQLAASELQKWKNEIEEKNLSFQMRKNIYSEFRSILNYGVKLGHLQNNPLKRVGNFKDAYETKKNIDFYTADEFLKFIKAIKESAEKNPLEWDYYVFFNLAFFTGMRKGEIHALKWADVEGDIIHVRRSISQKINGGDRETPPKNKSSFRSLQMPLPLKNILADHYNRCAAYEGFTDDWRVCGGAICLRDTSIENRNKTYAELTGIKKIRIHDFRHSHATLLANEGINIQEIARRLGHAKIEMTLNTYSHLYPREEERAVSVLNGIIEKNV